MFYLDKLDMFYICGSVPALVTAKPCAYMYVVNINVSITDAEYSTIVVNYPETLATRLLIRPINVPLRLYPYIPKTLYLWATALKSRPLAWNQHILNQLTQLANYYIAEIK